MRRSNSSGWPVSSACTGASKPSACADFGTSCTWPSVIMMTPASRSGGVLASALLRSANRLVPDAVSPVGLDEVTQRTCRLRDAAELGFQLAPDGRGLLGPAGDASGSGSRRRRRWRCWRGSRAPPAAASGWRAPAAARPATARAAARRGCAGTAAAPPGRPPAPRRPRTAGAGTIGEKSIDQLLIALAHPRAGGDAMSVAACTGWWRVPRQPLRRDCREMARASLPSLSSRAGTCTWSAL